MKTIGLIGAGQRLRAVVRELLSASDGHVRVAAVFDPDPLSIAAVRGEFGTEVQVCESVQALVRRADLDWVFIGSMNCQHAQQSIEALQAGKNVFCEKPLATDLEDCRRVRAAVEETGKVFALGLELRYAPHYQKIQEIVRSGRLGTLISFEFNETLSFNHGGYIFGNWRRQRAFAGSHLLEKCCHDLDLANWLVGGLPRWAASFGGRDFFLPENARHISRLGEDKQGGPAYMTWPDPHRVNPFSPGADILDNQVAILEYENGVRATFHTNCHAGLPERRFYLCGSEGSLRADAHAGLIEVARIGHDAEIERIPTGASDGDAQGEGAMARALVETLLNGTPPLASVKEGLLACATAWGIDQAQDTRQVTDYQPFWDSLFPHELAPTPAP
jgi:predicted dehydrogenase